MTGRPDGDHPVVGLFVNGEAVLPRGVAPVAYPLSDVLTALLALAEEHGADVRERVMVRSWTDGAVSGTYSPYLTELQARVFQLRHVARTLGETPADESDLDGPASADDVSAQLDRTAGNWSDQATQWRGASRVTVVLVGAAEAPELADGVDLVRVAVEHDARRSDVTVRRDPEPVLVIGTAAW